MTVSNQTIPQEGTEYIAGNTATIELTINDEDGGPRNLQGADVTFTLAEYRGSSVIFKKELGDGIELVDAESGRVDIHVSEDDTKDLGGTKGKDYHFEVTVTDDVDDVVTVATGKWKIYTSTR